MKRVYNTCQRHDYCTVSFLTDGTVERHEHAPDGGLVHEHRHVVTERRLTRLERRVRLHKGWRNVGAFVVAWLPLPLAIAALVLAVR